VLAASIIQGDDHSPSQITWRNTPEDSPLHTRRLEDLKSHLNIITAYNNIKIKINITYCRTCPRTCRPLSEMQPHFSVAMHFTLPILPLECTPGDKNEDTKTTFRTYDFKL
jgi:hypothetical protein